MTLPITDVFSLRSATNLCHSTRKDSKEPFSLHVENLAPRERSHSPSPSSGGAHRGSCPAPASFAFVSHPLPPTSVARRRPVLRPVVLDVPLANAGAARCHVWCRCTSTNSPVKSSGSLNLYRNAMALPNPTLSGIDFNGNTSRRDVRPFRAIEVGVGAVPFVAHDGQRVVVEALLRRRLGRPLPGGHGSAVDRSGRR